MSLFRCCFDLLGSVKVKVCVIITEDSVHIAQQKIICLVFFYFTFGQCMVCEGTTALLYKDFVESLITTFLLLTLGSLTAQIAFMLTLFWNKTCHCGCLQIFLT